MDGKTTMTPQSHAPQTAQPWWRFGLVWMILAGPAVVVVAGFVTLYLAISHPDPVLQVTPRNALQQRQGITHAPAMQGRNHAATGEWPTAVTAPAEPAPRP